MIRSILYVANAAKIGGGNKVLMDLMRNLDPGRYRPFLVSPEGGPVVDWALEHDIPCGIVRAGDWNSRAALARRSLQLAALAVRCRARIIHAAAPTCYRAAGLAGLLTRTKRVCHLGFPPEKGQLERAFLSGPEAVIGCYRGQAAQHAAQISMLVPGCQVVGIPNGVAVETFAEAHVAEDVEALRPNRGYIVGILGHISEVKGYGTFIEAASQLARRFQECAFVSVGGETAEEGAQVRFEQLVRERGLTSRFRFLGFRNDVPSVLRAVDVVCLPSRTEGFPLAVLEAMAAGKPVVATPVGGVAEAVDSNVTGLLVPPDDAQALAKAIWSLLESPERRATIGEAGQRRVREQFSIETFATSIQRLYDTVAIHASRASPDRGQLTTRV